MHEVADLFRGQGYRSVDAIFPDTRDQYLTCRFPVLITCSTICRRAIAPETVGAPNEVPLSFPR